MSRTLLCLASLMLVTTLAVAQDLTIGTKTVPAMSVAFVANTSPLGTFKQDVNTVMGALWTACKQGGLHPLGVPILSLDLKGLENGPLHWEAWLALADMLDPAQLPLKPGLTLKLVPSVQVCYTYNAGDPWQMEPAFERLHTWATNQNLALSGRARAIYYVWPGEKGADNTMTEWQFELKP